MIPPSSLDAIDKHGGFTADLRNGSCWRPGHILRRTTIGALVSFSERSFYQRNDNVTRAVYKVPGYRFPVLVWFDNETGERIA